MAKLEECEIFDGLPDGSLDEVQERGKTVELDKDEMLFKREQSGSELFIVLEGMLQITVPDDLSDRDITLALLGPPEVIGEMAVLTDNDRSADAKALRETELFSLDKESFRNLTEDHPKIALNLSTVLCKRLWETDSEIQMVAFNTLQSRIASQLLQLADKFGVPAEEGTKIDLKITHKMLADLIGTYRETITKNINQFKRKDILGEEDGRIVVKNRERLQRIG